MAQSTLVEAINLALASEMARDRRRHRAGPGRGRATAACSARPSGLHDRFGAERVIDTPLAEAMIAGMAIGMAAEGLKPVAEIQFSGFIYTCIDQILNHAAACVIARAGACPARWSCARRAAPASMRRSTTPRAPKRCSRTCPACAWSIPSSPRRAYGLLLAAIRDPDPVIFLEPTRLYRLFKEDVEDNGEALPLDTCFTLREGTDVTLVTLGRDGA